MKDNFVHPALELKNDKPLIYTAMSKHLYYFRMFISKFVYDNNGVPLNPFMISDYFMLDTVDRDVIREGNNSVVKGSHEIWVFGDVSNGVLAEIQMAKEQNKPVRYFKIMHSKDIVESTKDGVVLENEVAEMRHLL
ncbi:MAG: hypothetical protein JWM52_295 [Candidatus Saccharibacteria bacterium]|nr:hypothetical protein [Candidatus Saccharibacteria bacterium]